MTNPTLTPLNFQVSLALAAHSKARQFSAYHAQVSKAKQVYLNTLAVYAVQFYLNCLDFEVDLEESFCEDLVMQALMDVADLKIKNCGKIECRPIFASQQSCQVSPEVQEERIAYVIVRLNDTLSEAYLLGFIDQLESDILPINSLQSLDFFPAYLNKIRNFKKVDSIINLSEWLHNKMMTGWKNLEALLEPGQQLALGYRSGTTTLTSQSSPDLIRGAKLIDLGADTGDTTVILLITIAPETETEMGIRVQVHPAFGASYLPENIKLYLLSETGECLREISSRRLDNFIQLPYFRGFPDEQFKIKVAYNNNQFTEKFKI
ncbi:MAG: DUF1822 family protein [Cyanobacteriota bacterium]|nr:DUF1822 family protein [Cyanobacteriota bacterium]